jgi:peptidoglycan/xylan/chitin deacetylase (PgdA/CDA1 family)
MSFWVKTNYFVKKIFPNYVWDIPNNENKVFLTFDDGPIPEITEWTLEQLKKYDAKATFFCIGNNIEKHPEIFQKIIDDNHAIGNHTYNHLKGWETKTPNYIENVSLCQTQILNPKSLILPEPKENRAQLNLFRPPYGKIKPTQSRILRKHGYKIIMWDILSYDFDQRITPEKCLDNVLKNVVNGSIIVFHDNVKAEQNLKYALPKTLALLKEKGFVCAKID